MNKVKLLAFISLFILLPNITYADCTKEEINYFKRIEESYKITYQYNKDTKDYTITFYNQEPDKYEYMIYASKDSFNNCEAISNNETICHNVLPNDYYIEILGQTDTCSDAVKKINLNLSRYNDFSEDPLCEGIEEFVLCQPNYDKEIDYETFVSRVNTYKKNKQEKASDEPNIQEDNTDNLINTIFSFIKDNIFIISIIIIFVIVVIVTIILTAKSIRKSRRLE